jgi:hypothetical protein
MSVAKVEFFRAFLSAISSMDTNMATALLQFKEEFSAATNHLNPQQANDFAMEQFKELKVNQKLASLYDAVTTFINDHAGDGFPLENNTPIVSDVTETALAVSGRSTLSLSIIPQSTHLAEQSMVAQMKMAFLVAFLRNNVPLIQEFRIKQLKAALQPAPPVEAVDFTLSSFTLNQQVLALHFMLTEGMEVNNVDNTKVIALAHLLSGKKIPLDKDGHENIGNSGIKSAFGKMWQKQSKRHLADLRFVLRFFKPFENTSSKGMKRTVQAIEKEMAKTELRINKDRNDL